jgi:hypothetical protein
MKDRKTGVRPWWERVAPEHVAELDAFRKAWKAGEYGQQLKPVAIQVASFLNEQGIATIGSQGVMTWLRQKD